MIQSQPYSIPRTVLSRLAALYYLRTFWFVLVGPFLFGLVLIFIGPNQTARFFGLILAIWPATVFTRSLLLTGKAAKVWSKPTVMTVDQGAFLFESQTDPVSRLRLGFQSVRKVLSIAGYDLLQTRRFGFVPVPKAALPEGVDLARAFSEAKEER